MFEEPSEPMVRVLISRPKWERLRAIEAAAKNLARASRRPAASRDEAVQNAVQRILDVV